MIREAMRSKALVALVRVVLSRRERVMALEPYPAGRPDFPPGARVWAFDCDETAGEDSGDADPFPRMFSGLSKLNGSA